VRVLGDVIANHFLHKSDRRLKCDITELVGAIEILLQLEPKCFRWKDGEPFSHPIIGLIAQEVKKVAPNLVKKGQDGYWSVDYAQIIVILIAATKQIVLDCHDLKEEQKGTNL
jgi:hypothetical protein